MRFIWITLDVLTALAYEQLCVRRRRYWRWLDRLNAWAWERRYYAAHGGKSWRLR